MAIIKSSIQGICIIGLIGTLSACGGGGGSNTASPVATSYKVGGTLSGVPDDEAVTLQNSNGDIVQVSSNGRFSFPVAVSLGSPYAVTITHQPIWAACSISNGSGSANADISSIGVNCLPAKAQVTTTAQTSNFGSQAPFGLALAPDGTLYFSDFLNNAIFKMTPDGQGQQWAGGFNFTGYDPVNGTPLTSGFQDGPPQLASFTSPGGLAFDLAGNLLVADSGNDLIRKISPTGTVSTVAGTVTFGFADGPASSAVFNLPYGLAVDKANNIYVADSRNARIRKITAAGTVSTIAGSSTTGTANGTGSAASFNWPRAIAIGPEGNLYVSDIVSGIVRKVTPDGVVTTLAGSGTLGFQDGVGAGASFSNIDGVAVDANGTVYVADSGNHVIRRISSKGVVTTLAGSGQSGSADGIGTTASFDNPQQLVVDAQGNIYVADRGNWAIRKISPVQ